LCSIVSFSYAIEDDEFTIYINPHVVKFTLHYAEVGYVLREGIMVRILLRFE